MPAERVAVVTGAGRNIGEAVAKALAADGARIAVVDMDRERGGRVAREIAEAGGDAEAFVADVSAEEDVRRLVSEAVARFGRIDILVNNAAISDNKTVLDITLEEWTRTLAVTLTGPFLMSKHVAEQMVRQGEGGRIVLVGSTSGFGGRRRAVAYAAAKGGVANLVRALAVQLAPYDIRVTGVAPNKIGSPVGKEDFDPTRPVKNLRNRVGQPEDMARAIRFLVSDESDFIAGHNLFVDGGVSAMMPGDG